MAILIPVAGPSRNVRAKNGKNFQLAELYALLECTMIEIVTLRGGRNIMVIDEEGKLKRKHANWRATIIAFADAEAAEAAELPDTPGPRVITFLRQLPDVIVGTALVCDENEIE